MADRQQPQQEEQPERDEPGKPGLGARIKARITRLRQRSAVADHVFAMIEHYGEVQGNVLAGAATYFGFLSFFPVLALAFAVIGQVVVIYPAAEQQLVAALEAVFPGLIGTDDSSAPIKISAFAQSKAAAGLLGLLGLLYSGLGWVSGLREGLQGVFETPQEDKRNFVVGKAFDLLALVTLGLVLIVSVSVSGAVTAYSESLIDALGLDAIPGMGVFVGALGIAIGIAASTVLFFAMYRILPAPELPSAGLAKGALLAALGFEVLKLLASYLIRSATGNPAFALLGISLVLLVWINYFSRVAMYGAAWAFTTPEAREATAEPDMVAYNLLNADDRHTTRRAHRERRLDRVSIISGAVIGAVAAGLAMLRRRRG